MITAPDDVSYDQKKSLPPKKILLKSGVIPESKRIQKNDEDDEDASYKSKN
jgi:hypothetical protein